MSDTVLPPVGSVVISKAGRDANRYFVVVAHCKEVGYVMISDGALRKIDNPKKKKLKHLSEKSIIIPVIKERLANGERVYDYEIRSHLDALGYNT